MLTLRLFGSAEVVGSDGKSIDALARQPKRLALLAYLAIAVPRGFQRRDKLLGLFWPDLDEAHARNALSQALHVLRSLLGENAIVTRGDAEVGVSPAIVVSDVAMFEEDIDAGRAEEALARYTGDLLDGFFVSDLLELERWLDSERYRLRERAHEAAWTVANAKAQRGDTVEAISRARWAMALQAPDDVRVRRLMMFLHSVSDSSSAIKVYRDFAQTLAKEFELQPAAETTGLASRIREELGEAMARSGEPVRATATLDEKPLVAPGRAESRRTHWRSRTTAAVVVGGLALLGVSVTPFEEPASDEPRQPRMVVMPFQHLGMPQNAYFGEGIGDEIAARLAMVQGLNVIAGASARRYVRASGDQGAAPSADYFLNGTTTWVPGESGGHLRIRLQLTDSRDVARWGAVFEKEVAATPALFELIDGIAHRVVNEVSVALEVPRDTAAVEIPTTSLDAYTDYLRAREYLRRTSTAANFLAAISLLERAIERDPRFVLAHALLIHANTEAEWLAGLGQHHLDRAEEAGHRAIALARTDPDVNTRLAHYYYACCEDYERAMWHLTTSNARRPADARTVMFMGNIYKRQGVWEQAIGQYERAMRLDPMLRWPPLNLAHAHMWTRRYDDAERTFRRVLATEPQDIFAHAHLAWIAVLRDGDVAAARRIIAEAARSSDGFAQMRIPFYLELLDRKYDEALALLVNPQPGLTGSLLNELLVSDAIRRGLVFRLKGDSSRARVHFDSARIELELALKAASPRSRRAQLHLRSGLAMAYAGLGQVDESRATAAAVIAAKPVAVDAIEGPKFLQHLALAHVLLGDHDRAIDQLEALLKIGAPVSRKSLALEPFWDPLRSDRRFRRLVRSGS